MVIILIYLLAQHRVKHSVVDTRNDADAAAATADVAVDDEWLLTYAVEALSYAVYLVLTSVPVSGRVEEVVAPVRVSGVSVESAVVSSSVVAGDICPHPPWPYFSHFL